MAWISGPLTTNPGLGAVLVDTGPLGEATYRLRLLVSATTALEVEVQKRNAANDTTLKSQVVPVTLNWLAADLVHESCAGGERLRVLARQAVVGDVGASLDVTHA